MAERRTIKRYTNRKLYDKLESRYVTLEEIARLVRSGEDVMVIDNESEEDLTSVTFAQIILEEEKRKTNLISVPFLRKLIRSGEARVQDFSDRATRSIEALGDLTEKAGERVREVMEGGGRAFGDRLTLLEELFDIPQKRLDALRDSARRSMGKIRTNPTVRRELERIASSLHTIEEAITRLGEEEEAETAARAHSQQPDSSRSAAPTETGAGDASDADANGMSTPAGSIKASDVDLEEPYPSSGEGREAGGDDAPPQGPRRSKSEL